MERKSSLYLFRNVDYVLHITGTKRLYIIARVEYVAMTWSEDIARSSHCCAKALAVSYGIVNSVGTKSHKKRNNVTH